MPVYTATDGARIAYDSTGTGRPVILIHGWSANRHFYDRQIPALAERYRVVSLDLRGHGDSERGAKVETGLTLARLAADIRELARHLEMEKPVLVGWSMGTSIILDYVRQWGCADLGALCLIDMTPKLLAGPDWDLGLIDGYDEAVTLRFLNRVMSDWPATAEGFVPFMFSKSRPPGEEELAWVRTQVADNTPFCMGALWAEMATKDYRDVLGAIDVPTLLTFGDDGHFYGPRHGRYMKAAIGPSHLVTFPGCGHALQREDPERFNEALVAFIETHPSA